jgi:hypothetical protein
MVVAVVMAVMVLLGAPGVAHAHQGQPVGWVLEEADQTIVVGRVVLRYEPELHDEAEELAELIPEAWEDIENELGADVDDRLMIHFVDHAGLISRATDMPQWVAGVANSRRGEIVIARHSPDGSRTDLEGLLRHEMVHVALYRATDGAVIPRWFNEGTADSIGDAVDPMRVETLASAIFGGGVPALPRLERDFYGDDRQAMVAYAASRDFVAHLRFHDSGPDSFRDLISGLRGGGEFELAIADAYGASLDELESEWREGLLGRFVWYPIVGSGSLPMALGGPILFVAWFRRRRAYHRGLARLEAEEIAEQEARKARAGRVARPLAGVLEAPAH